MCFPVKCGSLSSFILAAVLKHCLCLHTGSLLPNNFLGSMLWYQLHRRIYSAESAGKKQLISSNKKKQKAFVVSRGIGLVLLFARILCNCSNMAVYVENRNQRNNQESAGKAKNSLNPSEAKTTISHLKTFRRVLLGFIPIFILSILN